MFERTTRLYLRTMKAIQDGHNLIVHQGGSSSSKTYSTCQALIALTFHDPGCIITVAGQDIPNLKKGPIRDTRYILTTEPKMAGKFEYNKSERIYTNRENGSIIEFNSYDDEQDAKSGRRGYLFANEANGMPYDVFDALRIRTRRAVIIDFNPNARFWAHEKIFPDKRNRKWFVSTFRNNPYIDAKMKADILSYEPTPENIKRGTANEYKWQVYGLGQVGRLEGLVFPNFEVYPIWPEVYKWRVFGMDFGFTNDPTTLVEVRYVHGNLYWRSWFYERGMTNTDISTRLVGMEFPRNETIIADSAEPKSIKELQDRGFRVEPSVKGTGSVNTGIDVLKRYNSYIYAGDKNLIDEFNSYTWKIDRNGNPLNEPIDKSDHGIGAGRYGVTHRILKHSEPIRPRLI